MRFSPWRFGAVDGPRPNAFALPGGFIYFTRGRLGLITSVTVVAEFHTRCPSQVEPGELALISGVASPTAVLPAGSQVKRVAAP